MSAKRILFVVLVASAVMLAVGIGPRVAGSAQALPQAQEPNPPGVTIPYPGRLDDEAGQPVADGAYDFTFALYDGQAGGEPLWSEVQRGVVVQSSSFIALLGSANGIPREVLDGTDRWLAVSVRSPGEAGFTALAPRQRLSAISPAGPTSPAAPTNGMACPHDHFGETWSGTSGDGLAIVTSDSTANAIEGSIGPKHGVSNNGIFGETATGNGVYGRSNVGGKAGVHGYNSSGGYGVYGRSEGGVGVAGVHVGSGNYAELGGSWEAVHAVAFSSAAHGVYAQSSTGDGVKGESAGNGKSGVYGHNTYTAFGGYGVYGRSDYGRGVQGEDGGPDPDDSFGVFSLGDMYTSDDLNVEDQLTVGGLATFNGGKSGYVVEIAQNDDTVPLAAGDVVVISGAGPAVVGEIPVIKVRRAAVGETSAVVGVVDQHYIPAPTKAAANPNADVKAESAVDDAAIAPGEYLTVVTLGAYEAIKVDASYGAIAPGDLLVASPNPSYAMRATTPKPGTIIGKALESLASGTSVIPVIITLQ